MDESFTSDSSIGHHAKKAISLSITRSGLLARLRSAREESYALVSPRAEERQLMEKEEEDVEPRSFAIMDDTRSELSMASNSIIQPPPQSEPLETATVDSFGTVATAEESPNADETISEVMASNLQFQPQQLAPLEAATVDSSGSVATAEESPNADETISEVFHDASEICADLATSFMFGPVSPLQSRASSREEMEQGQQPPGFLTQSQAIITQEASPNKATQAKSQQHPPGLLTQSQAIITQGKSQIKKKLVFDTQTESSNADSAWAMTDAEPVEVVNPVRSIQSQVKTSVRPRSSINLARYCAVVTGHLEHINGSVHAEHIKGTELIAMFKKDERFRRQQPSHQKFPAPPTSSVLNVDMSDLDSVSVASSIGPSASQSRGPVTSRSSHGPITDRVACSPATLKFSGREKIKIARRPRKVPWNEDESNRLLAAIKKYGRQGSLIKEKYFRHSNRTAQNIRDRMKYFEKHEII